MIQYIRIETDDSGEIIKTGLGGPCVDCTSAYETVKKKLAAESGLEDFCTVEEHLAAIKSKARLGGLNSGQKYTKDILAKHSGLVKENGVGDHIAAIKLKTYNQGYDKGWSDKQEDIQKRVEDADAFEQYAEEKMEPIFKQLSEVSRLSADNHSVNDHLNEIIRKAKTSGRLEKGGEIFKELSKASGISEIDWAVSDHVEAIQEKAPGVNDAFEQYAAEKMEPIFRQLSKESGLSENNWSVLCHINWIKNKARQEGLDETKEQMKDLLAKQSGLDHSRSIDDHIREIVKNSMEAGAAEERDRIQEKIEELLS